MNAAAPGNGRRSTQPTRTDWPRPVSVAAGSQRHARAGWNGPAPLLSLLAAGSNARAPHGRGKGRDMPRRRTALIPAGQQAEGPEVRIHSPPAKSLRTIGSRVRDKLSDEASKPKPYLRAVLQVRIHLPPAESPLQTQFWQRRLADDIAAGPRGGSSPARRGRGRAPPSLRPDPAPTRVSNS